MRTKETNGQKMFREIINEILKDHEQLSLNNNVLSSRALPDNIEALWSWFGEVRVKETNKDQTKAGEMRILTSWKVERDELDDDRLIISIETKESIK